MPPDPPVSVQVIVPAHNEESLIGRALTAIASAGRSARSAYPGLQVQTTVVLDSCTDGTRAVVAQHDVRALEVCFRCVGSARRAGVDHVGRATQHLVADQVWVASTDADSMVPESWVRDQVRLARTYDLVVGAVRPHPDETPPDLAVEWRRRHPVAARHVHGANLGFRLSTYRQTPGFEHLTEHEDIRLVEAFERAGARVGTGTEVVTSPRHAGRTRGGFAGYMATLAAELSAGR